MEEAKKIALKDAKLDELVQKSVFTREELSRNQGKPCYLLEFYTGTNQYFYQIDAKSGSIIYAGKFITLSEAKKIALDDAGCKDKVSFTEETLVSGGIKTPYYRLVFADTKTQWTYRIDAVLGTVLEKQQKEIVTTDFISLEEAKEIALKDAGLNESTQKIVFTREELNRNQGKPCYILEFYTAKKQYSYKVDAKNGNIMEAYHFILLADAKKIVLDDAGVSEKVTFTEETLVAGGIKSPYYYFAFESASARWTYKIDAVLGVIMDKTCDKIIPTAPEFIGLEKAKQIALEDAGLDETAQKIVFTREELSRNSGKPCYILEFYTAKKQYSYKVDAKNGSIIEAYHFILLADAKKIALDDAGVNGKVVFTTEELVAGGIKTPYYRFVFADAKTQWTYRIDAVLGTVLEKQQKEIVTTDFISLEEAKEIALKDAGLNESTQKIVFTREELNRNQGKPCYILEFYTAKKQYSYKVDAKNGNIMEAYHFILLADAKKIVLDDAGVSEKVTFTEETLVAGGIKSPYYYFAFESASARWTYKIDAVLGVIMDKTCDKIIPTAPEFIGLEKAKQIALEDAGLDETAQKIVFTREELSRNSGKPCYILEFYTAKKQYSYKVDAKDGSIIEAYHFILLADAKKIALDDAGVSEKVIFTEETLVAGGIKSPYYYFAFESDSARWTYKIDAVLGVIMDKTCDKIIPLAPEFIDLEKAKQIALEDAGLDETAQKIVFTREELSRNQGKPCYILEFYTDKCAYSYKVDAVSGEIIGKKTEWFSRQESETVPDTSQNSDSKHR